MSQFNQPGFDMGRFKRTTFRYRVIPLVVFIILTITLITNCEKDKRRLRSYPRVRTESVTGISEKGATFIGNIFSLGSETIIDHGFVWGEGDNPGLNVDKILLGPISVEGEFRAEILTTLSKDVKYTVKAFVRTYDHIVYGPPVRFVSLGSGAPVITDFSPISSEWLDTIVIRGKNFSFVESENLVKLGNTRCDVFNSTDTTVSFTVSKDLPETKSVLSVDIQGNKSVFIRDTFKLNGPVIQSLVPLDANWGDTIILQGYNFESRNLHNEIRAFVNGFPATILSRTNERLSVQMPFQLKTTDNPVSFNFNKMLVNYPYKLKLKPPVINRITPEEGTWGDIITIKGKFHPDRTRNSVSVGGINSEYLISVCRDSIQVYTGNLTQTSNEVILYSEPFTVISPDSFMLFPPEIDSITPLTGRSFSNFTVYGKYLYSDYITTTVKIGSKVADGVHFTPTQLDCEVPKSISSGQYVVSVVTGQQVTEYKDPMTITNPEITNVTPLTGTFGDEIILEGKAMETIFRDFGVSFDDHGTNWPVKTAEIVSQSPTRIVVKVPLSLDSIPKLLKLYDFFGILATYTAQDFILSPPEIVSITPDTLISGGSVILSGKNFHPLVSGNEVYWGENKLLVESASPVQIVASISGLIPFGTNRISIKTGGYTRYSGRPYLLKL